MCTRNIDVLQFYKKKSSSRPRSGLRRRHPMRHHYTVLAHCLVPRNFGLCGPNVRLFTVVAACESGSWNTAVGQPFSILVFVQILTCYEDFETLHCSNNHSAAHHSVPLQVSSVQMVLNWVTCAILASSRVNPMRNWWR